MMEMRGEQNQTSKGPSIDGATKLHEPNAMVRSLKALKYQPLEGLIYLSLFEPPMNHQNQPKQERQLITP